MNFRLRRLIALKRWARQSGASFSSWQVAKGLPNLAVSLPNFTLSFAFIVGTSLGFAQMASPSRPETAGASIEGVVTAVGPQGQADAVPGVLVTLAGPSQANDPQTATTDAAGRYIFVKLAPGNYTVDVHPEGFKPFTESIALAPGSAKTQNISLELDKVIEKIEVRDKAAAVTTQSADSTATISNRQFTTLPIPEQKYTAILPLLSEVIQTRDGKFNFKGAPENQGMLLVDSVQTVDPVTGSFSIPIPLDAIQSMSVTNTPYNADAGGFSGGLTTIETKPPSGDWHYGVMDFIPGFRGKSGHLAGLAQLTPRLYFGGPLLKNKLNFSEAFTYDVNRTPVRGLAWPNDETELQGFDTLTSFQAFLSPQHLLSVNVTGFSNRDQFADITPLIPQTASSDEGQRGAWIGVADSYQFSSGALLNTMFRYSRFDSNAHGEGPQDMLITPEGWGGNFFNAWSRTANQFELLPAYKFPLKQWRGRHELKVGVDISHRSYHGTSYSHPIQLLRQDGSLAEQFDFHGGGRLQAQDTDVAEFVQDNWMLNDRLALDVGGRFSSQSIGRSAAFAPRAGLVYAPGADRKTVIRAGGGLFYGRVPLLAADFLQNPTRVASFYGESGSLLQPPIVFQNTYLDQAPGGAFVPVGRDLHTSPRNFTGNFEVDRQILRGMVFRASYLYSQTQNLYVVNPVQGLTGGSSLLGLANNGGSHYHEFEASLHYHPTERSELNVSYVRSHARGDLNALSDVYVPLEEPVIRPNFSSNLMQDTPNRVITSALVPLPWEITVSPLLDIHTGLPYSEVDTFQNYVGTPNAERFPTFVALNLKIYREFEISSLPFLSRFKGRKLRFGVYSINLTNHSNMLDIYNNVASPNFGRLVGFEHRVSGLVIDVVN